MWECTSIRELQVRLTSDMRIVRALVDLLQENS